MFYFLFFLRFIWNLEADDSGASVSLDAIVAGLNDETLSRITIGKYIKWLFPKAIPRRSVFKVDGRGVNRIGSYIGLKWTDWSSESQSDVQTVLISGIYNCVQFKRR